ncbi:MAG TPA: BON domain-containing protein [Steroidobacter sp.]|uniref:BON domain-containing protein n=1 Tax=Steroidobacter sp. TaxID=1978227 RepID=UPI002ED986A5
MALRDLFRGGRREHSEDRQRYPLDPLSRDSWHDETEARYGAHIYRDHDEERRRFNDRWENSYSGPGYGRFSDEDRGESRYGGTGGNPFYGERPLMNAGAAYEGGGYFGSKAGLPMTPWRSDVDTMQLDESVYGGRSFDADASSSQRRGQFSGFGPRGYRRSDERIKEDVCQCLTDDDHIDASNIEVAVNDREVMLSGTVTSRMQKRHAEDLIERLPGVRDVINSLRVVSETQGTQQGTQTTTRLGGTFR